MRAFWDVHSQAGGRPESRRNQLRPIGNCRSNTLRHPASVRSKQLSRAVRLTVMSIVYLGDERAFHHRMPSNTQVRRCNGGHESGEVRGGWFGRRARDRRLDEEWVALSTVMCHLRSDGVHMKRLSRESLASKRGPCEPSSADRQELSRRADGPVVHE